TAGSRRRAPASRPPRARSPRVDPEPRSPDRSARPPGPHRGRGEDRRARPVPCHPMSGGSPFGSGGDDPVPGFGLVGDRAKMLQNQGGFQWDQARAMAMQLATGGESEPNPDPLVRIKLEQLARVAELHVAQVTGLSTSVTGRPVSVIPVTRAQ